MQENKSKREEKFLKKKVNLPTDLIPFTKMNSKWITDLNVKSKIETQEKTYMTLDMVMIFKVHQRHNS